MYYGKYYINPDAVLTIDGIKEAFKTVAAAGGIADEAVSVLEEGKENLFGDREWFVKFHNDTKKDFDSTCKKFGMKIKR